MTLVMCTLEVERLKVLRRLANTSRREGVPQKNGRDDKLSIVRGIMRQGNQTLMVSPQ